MSEPPVKKQDQQKEGHDRQRGESVSTVDMDELYDQLFNGENVQLTSLQGMAILYHFVADIIKIGNANADCKEKDNESNSSVSLKRVWDEIYTNIPKLSVYAKIIESINSKEEVERLRQITRSQEELGVTLRQHSKILSNFNEENETTARASQISEYARRLGISKANLEPDQWKKLIGKFYLKEEPRMNLLSYIDRIHQHGSISSSVAICAVMLLWRFITNVKEFGCVNGMERMLPLPIVQDLALMELNNLNSFRLILTSLRLSLKLIEDKNFTQKFYCKVVGLPKTEDLFRLELSMGFGLNWSLFFNEYEYWKALSLASTLHRIAVNLNPKPSTS